MPYLAEAEYSPQREYYTGNQGVGGYQDLLEFPDSSGEYNPIHESSATPAVWQGWVNELTTANPNTNSSQEVNPY